MGWGLPMAFLGFGVLISILLFFWKKREILWHWGMVAMGYPTREALVSITYLLSPLEGGMNGNPLSVCNKYCLLLEIACEWVAPEEGPQYLPHGSNVVCFGTLFLCHTYAFLRRIWNRFLMPHPSSCEIVRELKSCSSYYKGMHGFALFSTLAFYSFIWPELFR